MCLQVVVVVVVVVGGGGKECSLFCVEQHLMGVFDVGFSANCWCHLLCPTRSDTMRGAKFPRVIQIFGHILRPLISTPRVMRVYI